MRRLNAPRKLILFGCFLLFCAASKVEAQFRPALIGNAPKALVNVIDTQKLLKKGQRELAIAVDSVGVMKDLKVASENPPGFNFGRAALVEYAKTKFILFPTD